MSLLPSTLAVMMVVLLAGASSQLVQDAALSSTQLMHQQLAMARAGVRLRVGSAALSAQLQQQPEAEAESDIVLSVPDLVVEQIKPDDLAELGELPTVLYRLTSTGRAAQASVTLQADYAVMPCDLDHSGCIAEARRIAWRSLAK
ncbi:MAG: hypothetical protein KGN40_12500 [Burkholderiales bacterium]|nr:hypothetical protein [Burkholderiales bacterium]